MVCRKLPSSNAAMILAVFVIMGSAMANVDRGLMVSRNSGVQISISNSKLPKKISSGGSLKFAVTPADVRLLKVQIAETQTRRLQSYKSVMKKIHADIKTLHGKTNKFVRIIRNKKFLYKKIQRIKTNIVYSKKFLKVNKMLKPSEKSIKNSKAKSNLKKHKTKLMGLIGDYKEHSISATSAKKQREALVKKIGGYEIPFSIFHKKSLARKERRLVRRLDKKMSDCADAEVKWKQRIEKARTWRAKLNELLALIKKNQENGDPKKQEWQLEENYKLFFKEKINLIAKYERKEKSIKKCGANAKNLKFKLMKIRYRSYDETISMWAIKKITKLRNTKTWLLSNPIRHILTKNEFEKKDLSKKMKKVLKLKNQSQCLKGVLLWEEVGREVTKERERDWLSYFTPQVKEEIFDTFKGLKKIYDDLKNHEQLRAKAYIALSKNNVRMLSKSESQNPNLKDELNMVSRKIKRNYFKSDHLYSQFEVAVKKAKKTITKVQERISKGIMKDGLRRRISLMKKVRRTMRKQIKKLKKKFFRAQKRLVALRKVYHEKIDVCLATSACDKSDLRQSLAELASEIEPLVDERQKFNNQVFR